MTDRLTKAVFWWGYIAFLMGMVYVGWNVNSWLR
jgi:hypothetical protein